MKNSFLILLAIFGLLVSTGCGKDDDDDNSTRNEFVIDGESTQITRGYVEYLGQNFPDTSSFDIDVFLTTDDLAFNSDGDFTGSGDLLYFDFNSNTETALVEGTYSFSQNRNEFTLVPATSLFVGIDVVNELEGTIFAVIGGTVKVEVNGTETKLEFDVALSNGENLNGQFEGPLVTIF